MDLVRQYALCVLCLAAVSLQAQNIHAEGIGESILVNPGWIVYPDTSSITTGKIDITENNPITSTPGGVYRASEYAGPTSQRFSPYTDMQDIMLEGTPDGLTLAKVEDFGNAMDGIGQMNTVFDGPEMEVNGANFLSSTIRMTPSEVDASEGEDSVESQPATALLASDQPFTQLTSPQAQVAVYKPWEISDRTSAEKVYDNDATVNVLDRPIVFDKARLTASSNSNFDLTDIPEPSTWIAMLIGLFTLTYIRRAKR